MTLFAKRSSYFIIFLLLATLFSCSARIDGVVREGGAADLRMTASLGSRSAALIRTFMAFASESKDGPILDGDAISSSLAGAPGIGRVLLKNTGPAALEGSISLINVGDFLAVKGATGSAGKQFITYTEGRTAGSSSIIMVLDKNSAPQIISMLSPEVEDYLLALMAPAVLGETSTRQEYLNLLASFYGRPLSDEVASARIRASIEFPRPVVAVKGGTAEGRLASFNIPLTDILVLESPLQYEISW